MNFIRGPLLNRRLDLYNRRSFLSLGAAVCAGLGATACTPPKSKITRKTTALGERAEVGQLVFVAMEANWASSFGSMPRVRVARNQFMAVRMSITNQGGQGAGCPLLSLVDGNDQRYPEVDDAKEFDEWLGLVRMIGPGATEFGWIVFDVPPSNYVLRLTNGDVENEQVGFVDIPLRMEKSG